MFFLPVVAPLEIPIFIAELPDQHVHLGHRVRLPAIAALRAADGLPYEYPLTLRLIR